MCGTLALVVGGVVGMEMWARWAHRALWHDFAPGWALHKSHHEPRIGPFEVRQRYRSCYIKYYLCIVTVIVTVMLLVQQSGVVRVWKLEVGGSCSCSSGGRVTCVAEPFLSLLLMFLLAIQALTSSLVSPFAAAAAAAAAGQ
jgi:hypothetical protein